MAVDEMTFLFAEELFQACLPLFEILLEEARLAADGEEVNELRMESALNDIEKQCAHVTALKQSQYAKQMENVRGAIADWKEAMDPVQMAAYTLLPFLLELREEIYFWGCVAPWKDRRQKYWKQEFPSHHRREKRKKGHKPLVSVFIPAKNQLSYTKCCVESVLRHTKEVDYELLLLDHGSDDDTYAYFCSIPNAKVIRFRQNVRMLMFTTAFRACRGKYLAFVSNDTIVTAQWLQHLLACMESESHILSATPVTPFTSNCQAILPVPLEELDGFAARFYRTRYKDWRQRARMMPVIAVYDGEKLDEIGFADGFFQTMEFWDDDVSLRARRRGYRQFLCTDVYCHHFGSVTGRSEWQSTLQQGRELFFEKHGVDAWGKGFCRSEDMMQLLEQIHLPMQTVRLLAVDCGFGDSFFETANWLRRQGKEVLLYVLTEESAYREELLAFAQGSYMAFDGTETALGTAFAGLAFDLILTEHGGNCGNVLAGRLSEEGLVLAWDGMLEPYLCKEASCGAWSLWKRGVSQSDAGWVREENKQQ